MIPGWLNALLYLVASICFIVGLKRMNSPATARQGNVVSGWGMLLAIAVTLFDQAILGYGTIAAGLIVGSALGACSTDSEVRRRCSSRARSS